MGNRQSQLTDEELTDYKELTFLTRKEILHAFDRFKQLDPVSVKLNKDCRLPSDRVANIPELKNNPFSGRICSVFDSEGDDAMSFEDFLDMVSVFSPSAPLKTKSGYAFHIYDFDEDGFLSGQDICKVVQLMTKEPLTVLEMEILIQKVMQEADLDKDGMLSPAEFEHVMRKSPDFVNAFSFRL